MMVGGAIVALFALAVLVIVVVILIITTIFKPKLGLFGFAALILFIFGPVVWQNLSYRVEMAMKGVSHWRELPGGSYGVQMDGPLPFRLGEADLFDDPRRNDNFVADLEGAVQLSFFIDDIVAPDQTLSFRDCMTLDTAFGLLEYVPVGCFGNTFADQAYRTPLDAELSMTIWCLDGDLGRNVCNFRFLHAGMDVRGYFIDWPIDAWQQPIDQVIAILDQSFTAYPK